LIHEDALDHEDTSISSPTTTSHPATTTKPSTTTTSTPTTTVVNISNDITNFTQTEENISEDNHLSQEAYTDNQ
jgi:hypothetical protein